MKTKKEICGYDIADGDLCRETKLNNEGHCAVHAHEYEPQHTPTEDKTMKTKKGCLNDNQDCIECPECKQALEHQQNMFGCSVAEAQDKKPQHTPTPTPWKAGEHGDEIGGVFLGIGRVATCHGSDPDAYANAAYIVKCVNSHEKLLKAAHRAIQALAANGAPNCESVKELKAVIAEAESL